MDTEHNHNPSLLGRMNSIPFTTECNIYAYTYIDIILYAHLFLIFIELYLLCTCLNSESR
jgi:hypothetical protein